MRVVKQLATSATVTRPEGKRRRVGEAGQAWEDPTATATDPSR